jgi:hypothetical protein
MYPIKDAVHFIPAGFGRREIDSQMDLEMPRLEIAQVLQQAFE